MLSPCKLYTQKVACYCERSLWVTNWQYSPLSVTLSVNSVFRCNKPPEEIKTFIMIGSLIFFILITNVSLTTDRLYLLFLVGSTNPGRIIQGNMFNFNNH